MIDTVAKIRPITKPTVVLELEELEDELVLTHPLLLQVSWTGVEVTAEDGVMIKLVKVPF